MEIPARVFFSFWAITAFSSLYLGMRALERTNLPNLVPPPVMSFFNMSLLISACHSSTYALVFRPKLIKKYYVSLVLVMSSALFDFIAAVVHSRSSFDWYAICIQGLCISPFYYLLFRNNLLDLDHDDQTPFYLSMLFTSTIVSILLLTFLCESFGHLAILSWHVLMMLQIPTPMTLVLHMAVFTCATTSQPLPPAATSTLVHFLLLVVIFVFFTCTIWAAISGDDRLRRWLAMLAGQNRILSNLKNSMKRNGKVIEFGVGMVGTIIFQNYFRLKSFDDVVAFLYLALAWLANLAMLLCPQDFGIFNFLLGNVIVGCTVGEFGLGATTWLVYGTCLLMNMLRFKLGALSLVHRGQGHEPVVVWGDHGIPSDAPQSLPFIVSDLLKYYYL